MRKNIAHPLRRSDSQAITGMWGPAAVSDPLNTDMRPRIFAKLRDRWGQQSNEHESRAPNDQPLVALATHEPNSQDKNPKKQRQ